MNFAVNSATWASSKTLPLFAGGALTFYTGAQPSTPETALSGNTALCTFTFSAVPFGSASFTTPNVSATASFAATSVTPGASGTVTFARATLSAVAWAANTTYSQLYKLVTNGGNYYVNTKTGVSAASGGPTGTVVGIQDNTCQWDYYAPATGQNNVLGDFSVGTAGTDIIIGNTGVTTTVNVTLTSLVLNTTAS